MIKRFNRFELKYIITAEERDALVPAILQQMRPDLAASPSGAYTVASLYYDTADRAFMRAKIEGIKFRRKLRIRRYGQLVGDDPEVAVEIKQRINRTTQKRRLFVPLSVAYALCAGVESGLADAGDLKVAGEVIFLSRALTLYPTCVVGYVRQAYVGGPYEPGLRITFDHALWAKVAKEGLSTSVPRHALLRPDVVVMEVKANNAVPMWLAHLLARHRCPLRRYSKYCAGAAHLLELGLLAEPVTDMECRHG